MKTLIDNLKISILFRCRKIRGLILSPFEIMANNSFETFAMSSTFSQILISFNEMCIDLSLDPSDYGHFYESIKEKVSFWKAEKLWQLLDQKMKQVPYLNQKACSCVDVLIIGAGPCGLRMAIECALLGCKVVVLEKRDKFSRNNVLHIWPFVIHDLKSLGAKFFYPKFCAGAIDHISIRQLQCMLLKIALLLGVEIYENTCYVNLREPQRDSDGQSKGWRVKVLPHNPFFDDFHFDVIIGADGKRYTLPGFTHKEFRGKLALAITANFVNRRTEREERVTEIAGISSIFKQQFFKDMCAETGVDLENIVYYKDDTHYFVMTAKKQSLLERKVLKQDFDDVATLLSSGNIDQNALLSYACDAADFVTEGTLPRLTPAVNQSGRPDVAIFDFTSLYNAENSCRLIHRESFSCLMSLVGDSLHEPFWPTGSGAARGFLSVFDSAWMIKSYFSGKPLPLEVLALREATFRLLAQTSPENLNKMIQDYTIDPRTRYSQVDIVQPDQVVNLIDTDDWSIIDNPISVPNRRNSEVIRNRRLSNTFDPKAHAQHQNLIRWFQRKLQPYRIKVDSLTGSFRSGRALDAILKNYLPENEWPGDGDNALNGNHEPITPTDLLEKAQNFIANRFGIKPPASLQNKHIMYEYLNLLRHNLKQVEDDRIKQQRMDELVRPPKQITSNDQVEPKSEQQREKVRQRHAKRVEKHGFSDPFSPLNQLKKHKAGVGSVDKISPKRLQDFEQMLRDTDVLGFLLPGDISGRRKVRPWLKTRKLDQREIDEMEEKLKTTAMGCLIAQNKPVPEPSLSSLDAKIIAEKTAHLKRMARNAFKPDDNGSPVAIEFDRNLKKIDRQLRLPNLSGALKLADLLDFHTTHINGNSNISKPKKKAPVPLPHETNGKNAPASPKPQKTPTTPVVLDTAAPNNSLCYFCAKKVYLAERLTIDNTLVCHKSCFKCACCSQTLRMFAYRMEWFDIESASGVSTRFFFCPQHATLNRGEKMAKIKSLREPIVDSPKSEMLSSILETINNQEQGYFCDSATLNTDASALSDAADDEIDERWLVAHNMGLLAGGSEESDQDDEPQQS